MTENTGYSSEHWVKRFAAMGDDRRSMFSARKHFHHNQLVQIVRNDAPYPRGTRGRVEPIGKQLTLHFHPMGNLQPCIVGNYDVDEVDA